MTRYDVMPWKVTCIAYITRRFNHVSSIQVLCDHLIKNRIDTSLHYLLANRIEE